MYRAAQPPPRISAQAARGQSAADEAFEPKPYGTKPAAGPGLAITLESADQGIETVGRPTVGTSTGRRRQRWPVSEGSPRPPTAGKSRRGHGRRSEGRSGRRRRQRDDDGYGHGTGARAAGDGQRRAHGQQAQPRRHARRVEWFDAGQLPRNLLPLTRQPCLSGREPSHVARNCRRPHPPFPIGPRAPRACTAGAPRARSGCRPTAGMSRGSPRPFERAPAPSR